VLELRGIRKRYHSKTALEAIDLAVAEGESLVVLGPNGAGKTTLIKIMAGLMSPSEGRVLWGGRPAEGPGMGGEVFFLGHRNSLYNSLTVGENLDFCRRLFEPTLNGGSASIDDVLLEHGLLERRDDPVKELSQGMKRRVAIARGFLTGARLFILDEPFTGLDLRWRRAVLEKIRELRDAGRSLVLSTHLLQEGYELADRIAFLDRGRLLFVKDKRETSVRELDGLFLSVAGERQCVP